MARILDVPVQFFFEDMPKVGVVATVDGFAETGDAFQMTDFLSSPEGVQLNRAFAEFATARFGAGSSTSSRRLLPPNLLADTHQIRQTICFQSIPPRQRA